MGKHHISNKEQSGLGLDTSRARKNRIGYTIALILLWTVLGLFNALITVCLPDLRDRVGASTESMSLAVGAKGIGSMVGGLSGGVLHDRFHSKSSVFLASALLLAGISVMSEPWTGSVHMLGVAIFTEGLAQGCIDAVGTSLVTRIWRKHADPVIHCIHFGSAIGALCSPFIAAPFLSDDANRIHVVPNATVTSVYTRDVITNGGQHSSSRVEVPYFIAGGLNILVSMVFWILVVTKPHLEPSERKKTRRMWRNIFNPASCADGKAWFGVTMVILFILWAMCSQAIISTYNFNFMYATESDMALTKQEGAWFDFSVKCARVVGRLFGIIFSHFLPIQVLLMAELIAMVITTLLTAFVGINHRMVFFISCSLTHMMFAPAWSGIFGFIDKYICLASFVVALSMIGSGVSIFVCTWMTGYLFDNVSRESIFYLSAGASLLMVILQVVMQVVGSINGQRRLSVDDDDNRGSAFMSDLNMHTSRKSITDDYGDENKIDRGEQTSYRQIKPLAIDSHDIIKVETVID